MNSIPTQAERFKEYISGLGHLKTNTKSNYRTYVNWLVGSSSLDFDKDIELSETRIDEIAQSFRPPGIIVNDLRRNDVRTILRLYRKFIAHTITTGNNTSLPTTADEGRKRILASIAVRRGQLRFRNELLVRYQNRCVVTGTEFTSVLEAAHIIPFSSDGSDHVSNGLLLRSDVHVLFDLLELSINPHARSVYCTPRLRKSAEYAALHGKVVSSIPIDTTQALEIHYEKTKRG